MACDYCSLESILKLKTMKDHHSSGNITVLKRNGRIILVRYMFYHIIFVEIGLFSKKGCDFKISRENSYRHVIIINLNQLMVKTMKIHHAASNITVMK